MTSQVKMAAVYQREQVSLRTPGTAVTIANDKRARLMYYLDSMSIVLDLDANATQRRFRDFRNYSSIQTIEEKKALFYLCHILRPEVLNDKCIFNSEDIDADNKFIEITNQTSTFAANENVSIAGQQTRVTNIMLYKMSWIQRNFVDPMQELAAELESLQRPQVAQITFITRPNTQASQPTAGDSDGCCVIL